MKTKSLEKTNVKSIVYDFFKQFPTWVGRSAVTPTVEQLDKYLSKNLQMHNNGQIVAKSSANYLDRLKKFQKKYSNFQISEPLEEPLIVGNQASIYYRLDLTTSTGQHKQVYIMGLFTIHDDKISKWIEVTNEKEAAGGWDA